MGRPRCLAISESRVRSEVVNRRWGPRVRWDRGAISDDLSAGFFAGFDFGTMEIFAENEQKIGSVFLLVHTLHHTFTPTPHIGSAHAADLRSAASPLRDL